MKTILNEMHGMFNERAIVYGMKTEKHPYNFGDYEIKCWVEIEEEEIKTTFAVFPKCFMDWDEAIFKTDSFKKLREWLQEHIEEIS